MRKVLYFLLLTTFLLYAKTSLAQYNRTESDDGRYVYFDNGIIKVGFDMKMGGVVHYLAKVSDGDFNYINNYDGGRQAGIDSYWGPEFGNYCPEPDQCGDGGSYKKVYENMRWNGLPQGSWNAYRDPNKEHHLGGAPEIGPEIVDGKIHIKSHLWDWGFVKIDPSTPDGLNKVDAKATNDYYITLQENGVHLEIDQQRNVGGEIPNGSDGIVLMNAYLYLKSDFYKLSTYVGSSPWNDGNNLLSNLYQTDVQGAIGVDNTNEKWMAMHDGADHGIGVIWDFETKATLVSSDAQPASEYDFKNAVLGAVMFDTDGDASTRISFDYALGTVAEIRGYAYRRKGISTNPQTCDFQVSASADRTSAGPAENINLTASCTGNCEGVNYSWSGTGLSATGEKVSVATPPTSGTQTYTVTASKDGCSVTASTSVTVAGDGGGEVSGDVAYQLKTSDPTGTRRKTINVHENDRILVNALRESEVNWVATVNGGQTSDPNAPGYYNQVSFNVYKPDGAKDGWGPEPVSSAGPHLVYRFGEGRILMGNYRLETRALSPSGEVVVSNDIQLTISNGESSTEPGDNGETEEPGGYSQCVSLDGACSGNTMETKTFSVNVPNDGIYKLTLSYTASEHDAVGQIKLNGGEWKTFPLQKTNGAYQLASVGDFPLTTGNNQITIGSNQFYLCFEKLCVSSDKEDPGTSNPPGGCEAPGAPDVSVSASSIKQGETVTLSAAGCDGEIRWSNGETGSSITVQPSQTTTYSATCSKNGCESVPKTVTINVDPRITIPQEDNYACVDLPDNFCSGSPLEVQSFNINIAGAGTYPVKLMYKSWEGDGVGQIRINGGEWKTFDLPKTGFDFTPKEIGNYDFVAGDNKVEIADNKDRYLCFGRVCVGQEPSGNNEEANTNPCEGVEKPNITADKSNINPGDKVTLSASAANDASITWSTGEAGASILVSPSATTEYTATLSLNECTGLATSTTVVVNGGTETSTGSGPHCISVDNYCSENEFEKKDVILNVPAEGNYTLTINYRAHEDRTGNFLIKINGGEWQKFPMAKAAEFTDATVGQFGLKQGENNITLAGEGTYFCMAKLCANEANAQARIGASEEAIIMEQETPAEFSVSPNPSRGDFSVSFNLKPSKKANLVLSDISGREIENREITGHGNHKEEFKLHGGVSGIFLIQLKPEGEKIRTKRQIIVK